MAGYEPHGEILTPPCDSCHAPCGWTPPTCLHDGDDPNAPCPAVQTHEAGHLADRVWRAIVRTGP